MISPLRLMKVACAALVLAAGARGAGATVLYSDTVLVRGPEFLGTYELPLNALTTYKVTTKDLEWFGVPLQALKFGVFTATGPIKSMDGAGTLEFFKAAPGKVFLQIYARPAGPHLAGLVSVDCQTELVVPLPPSILLLASSLAGYPLLRRGMRRRAGVAETKGSATKRPERATWLALARGLLRFGFDKTRGLRRRSGRAPARFFDRYEPRVDRRPTLA
jgi:hypothetical protein